MPSPCKPRSTRTSSTSTIDWQRAEPATYPHPAYDHGVTDTVQSGLACVRAIDAELKIKFQRQLHRSISARTRDSSEGRRIVHGSTGGRPCRVVSQVVRLGAELDPHSLHRAECLEHRKIDVH